MTVWNDRERLEESDSDNSNDGEKEEEETGEDVRESRGKTATGR